MKRNFLPESLSDNALLRLPSVLDALGIKKSCFYAGIKKGIYPPPTKIGKRISAWSSPVIAELLKRLANPGE